VDGISLPHRALPTPAGHPARAILVRCGTCPSRRRAASGWQHPPGRERSSLKVDYIEESPVKKALTFEVEPERVQQEIDTRAAISPAR